MKMRSYKLDEETIETVERLADERFGGNRSQVIRAGIDLLEARVRPSLEAEVFEALAIGARRRLAQVLTEPELAVCLQATRSWWVTGADAALIYLEIADMDPLGDEGDAVFGDGPGPEAPVNPSALAAKLEALPDLDRAVLTLSCRAWWQEEPRPPLSIILGRQLRGPRSN